MPRYTVLDRLMYNQKTYGPEEKLKSVEMAEEDAQGLIAAGVIEPAADKPARGKKAEAAE